MLDPKSAHVIIETPKNLVGKFRQHRNVTISTYDMSAWLGMCSDHDARHWVAWQPVSYGHPGCEYVVVTFDTFLGYLDGCSIFDDYRQKGFYYVTQDQRLCHRPDITFTHSGLTF